MKFILLLFSLIASMASFKVAKQPSMLCCASHRSLKQTNLNLFENSESTVTPQSIDATIVNSNTTPDKITELNKPVADLSKKDKGFDFTNLVTYGIYAWAIYLFAG